MAQDLKLNELHVRSFFGVDFVQFEADGRIYVEGPCAGYELCREEIMSCMRHMSARLRARIVHTFPASRIVFSPLLSERALSVEQV